MVRRNIKDQAGKEPIDVLSHSPGRDRSWETEQRTRGVVVTYRGIPPELRGRIKEIAAELGVTVGDVARRFLEHGLDAFESGALKLRPAEKVTKRTLYPDDV